MSRERKEMVITDDESFRLAILAMLKHRRRPRQFLKGIVGSLTFNRFLADDSQQQDPPVGLYTRSAWAAIDGLGYEVVIREKPNKKDQRVLHLKEQQRKREEENGEVETTQAAWDRDASGKLIRELTDEEKADVQRALDEYSSF